MMRAPSRLGVLCLVLLLTGVMCVEAQEETAAKAEAEQARPRRFRLSGRVLLPDGSGAVGATVRMTLRGLRPAPQGERDVVEERRTTDAEGRYDFGWLPVPMADEERPGDGSLFASLKGYGFHGTRLYFGAVGVGRSRVLEVTGEEVTYDLTLAHDATLLGMVVGPDDKPLDGVEVRLVTIRYPKPEGRSDYLSVLTGYLTRHTAPDGTFQLAGLPAGTRAECWMEKDGYVSARATLKEGQENRFALPLAGAIEGQVVFGDTRKPVPNVPVSANTWTSPRGDVRYDDRASAVTDEQGRFRLDPLPQSSATVWIGMRRLDMDYTAEKAFNVVVREGETTSGVVLTLTKGGTLKGMVLDAVTGKPVADAHIQVSRVVGNRWESYAGPRTDAQGRYSARLPANEYSLTFSYREGYYRGPRMRREEMPTAVVKEGEETEAPVIQVTPAARLAVRVLTPEGKPAAGIMVLASGTDSSYFDSRGTDDSGRVEIGGQRPGVTLQFTARNTEGTLDGEGRITPVLGEPNELVITLGEASPCAVVGGVVDEAGRPIAGATVSFFEPVGASMWRGGGRATSDDEGRFEIKALSPGSEYFVAVHATGYGRKSSDRLELKPGETYDVGVLTVAEANKELKGRVVDRNDRPLAGLRLNAYGRQSESQEAFTGKDGSFRFCNLVDESITIYVNDSEGDAPLTQERAQAGETDLVIRIHALGAEPKPEVVAEVGKPAPELVLEESATATLAKLKGRAVAVAFVSIYSRACARALLTLKQVQQQKGADVLGVIAVHDGTATPQEIEEFREDNGIAFPFVRVPEAADDGWQSETFRSYGVSAMPTVALIDREGKVVSIGDAANLSERISQLLGSAAD